MNQLLMHLELTKTIVDIADVESLMLTTMNPKLKKLHEGFIEIDMIKRIHERQARQERYETSKTIFQCMISSGSSMMGYIQALEKLGFSLKG